MVRRSLTVALLLALLVPFAPASVPQYATAAAATPPPSAAFAPQVSGPTPERIAGPDRYATAVAVSREAFERADTVVLATGARFPDALAGAPLAHALSAPLLLTSATRIPDAVRAEISRLGATRAVVLGGDDVVGPEVLADLSALGIPATRVERIAGTDRYATSAAIARRLAAVTGAPSRVMVTTGQRFPDALAGAGLAAASGMPILLTRPASIPAPVTEVLGELAPASTLVLGGASAVSDEIAATLPLALRVAGPDRYATAAALGEFAFAEGFTYTTVLVATGRAFPDALAAGPWAAALGAPLVLTQQTSLPAPAEEFFVSHCSAMERIVIVGGERAVSGEVAELIGQAARTVIAQGTVVLDTASLAELAEVTTDTAVFAAPTAQTAALVPGDVIVAPPVAAAPDGLLREVLSVAAGQGGALVVITAQASLADVIEKGSIDWAAPLVEATSTSGDYAPMLDLSLGTSHAFSHTFEDALTFSGELSYQGTLTLNADFGWTGLRSAEVKVRLESELSSEVEVALESSANLFGPYDIGPRVRLASGVVWVGMVPVTISGGAQAMIGLEGSARAGIRTGATLTAWAEGGARYDGSWSPIGGAGIGATYEEPHYFGAGALKAYTGVKVDVTIAGVIGPYCRTDLFRKLSFDTDEDPTWKISGGIDARVGGELKILDYELGSFEYVWTIWEVELARSPSRAGQGRIAFVRDGDVWVLDVASLQERRLTNTAESERVPVWSPDGGTIAFARGGEVWLMNDDGSNQRRPAFEDPEPPQSSELVEALAFAPDGTRLAVGDSAWNPEDFGELESRYRTYVVDVDSGGFTLLRCDYYPTDHNTAQLSWMPDGDILYETRHHGDMSSLLTHHVPSDLNRLIETGRHGDWGVDVHPSGAMLAMLELDLRSSGGSSGGIRLHLTDLDGRVTSTLLDGGWEPRLSPPLSWSPDGEWIALVRDSTLIMVNRSDGSVRILANDCSQPDWGP